MCDHRFGVISSWSYNELYALRSARSTGNHLTGSDYEQVRDMSSMPAKKRLAMEYREMASCSSDSMPPTSVTGNRHLEGSSLSGQCNANYYDNAIIGSDDRSVKTSHDPRFSTADDSECRRDMDRSMFDLQANKEKVLRLIADILASGDSNEEKERKLCDIIADLETVRRRLAEHKAARLKVWYVS